MTDTPQVLLAHHLKTLKLPTFLREYDKLARQCATEGADHVRYLVAREKPRHGLFSIPSRCFEVIVFARFRGFGLETLQFGKRNLRDSPFSPWRDSLSFARTERQP